MAAYLYGDIDITDPDAYDAYRARVPAVISKYGGRYLARGGAAEVLEGAPAAHRQVLLEFPSMEQLRAFYEAAEYQALKELRRRASTGRLIALEGLPTA